MKKILFVANTSWYLFNFRLLLIKQLQGQGYTVFVLAPHDEYVQYLTKERIICHHLKINRKGINVLSNFLTLISIYYYYHKIQPDIIIHFTIKPVIFGTLIARICTKTKVINNVTGLGYVFIGTTFVHTFLRPFVKAMYRCVLRLSDLLIFQNKDDRSFFIKSKIIADSNPPSVLISGSGVDLDKFQKKNIRTDRLKVHFILVARMLYDKGILEYVEAAKVVQKEYKNTVFHLLGDIDEGNPTAIPLNIINEWVNQKIIIYHGMVDDVCPFLENSDVFVLPSFREGLSKSIIEAMAMELPIITTDVPGCRETVIQYGNGLLIRSKNIPDLVNAMIYMIKNTDKLVLMGKLSREIAKYKFNVELINNEYIQYVETI
ncbi:MAG: glycosyltransferase family 4 protein [Candidatus Marinimicrobia bacterium]|nr:glycosyltransferase family 4 protein [Candidatus Neomarinimicrobiota bacterium]